MTHQERFLTAFRGGQPDRVPSTEAGIADNIILEINKLISGPEETGDNSGCPTTSRN